MRRPVEWLNAGGPLRRRDFPLVDNRLKERATVYSLTWGSMDFLEEIQPYLASDAVDDIEQVERRPNLDPTTRKALVNARLGQGQYRSAMLSKWGNACAATGCTLQAAIRASHAKPWRLSSDEERLDSNNGLPLVATLDALFDRGLIVIEEDGAISSRLSADDQEILQVPAHLVRKPSKSQAAYLRFHREYFRGKRD
jgi:predicted restriction endonuclease